MPSPTRRAFAGRALRPASLFFRLALVALWAPGVIGPIAWAADVQPGDVPRALSRSALRSESPADTPTARVPEGIAAPSLGPVLFPDAGDAEADAQALALQARRPGVILFDGARFDPLEDGEPTLDHFVPEWSSFDDLGPNVARHWVVQLHEAPTPAIRARLQALGIEVLAYVPRHAYLVRADALAMAAAADLPSVRWAGRYRPGYKVDRALGRLAAGRTTGGRLPGESQNAMTVDVLVTPSANPSEVATTLSAAVPGLEIVGASPQGGGPGFITVRLPLHTLRVDLAAVANTEDVIAIEPRGEIRLHNDDAAWIGQSYDVFAQRNYPVSGTIWKRGLMGEGEIIGLVDTGVDPDVCWMNDPLGLPPVSQVPPSGDGSGPIPVDLSRRKIVGYNLLRTFEKSATAYDVRTLGVDPHGTWAATSALGDNPARLANEANPTALHHDVADGMAPRAKLVVQDFADETGALVGIGRPDWLILDAIFEQLHGAGARVSTNSWGVAGNQYDLLAFFTDRMAWNHPDFLVVVSAGNEGPYGGSIESPGTAKSALTVGATDARLDFGAGLDPENVWNFSSRGPTVDGRLKPEILMSGHKLITGTSDRAEVGQTCTTAEATGTSFAAPLVAGFAALARQYYRTGFYPSGTRNAADAFLPSAALVRATLIAGARSVLGRAGNDLGPCVLDTCDSAVQLCAQAFTPCEDDADCRTCSADPGFFCTDDRDCDLSLVSDDAPANDQGWGRLHLDDVLYFPGDERGLGVWDIPRESGLSTGETWRTQVQVDSNGEDFQIVLSWPDPPALIASPSYLVNDLDLKVTAPNGTVYWGNAWGSRDRQPFTRSYTVAGLRPVDDPNTVEMVRIAPASATTGTWTVEVVGESVPGSPWIDGGTRQDFAVVAVGPVASGSALVRFTKPAFGCAGAVEVEVSDATATAPVTVTLTTTSGDVETLTLSSIGPGRYRGSLSIAAGATVAATSGVLEVVDGEELRAQYDDLAPVVTTTAFARASCGQHVLAGRITAAGGCDGDAYLDAGEDVDLTIPLANAGLIDLDQVRATLVSTDPRVFVIDEEASYGALPAGGLASGLTPFRVSLRDGIAPRTPLALSLEVMAEGWSIPVRVDVTLLVEADEVITQGAYTEDFLSVSGGCYDGDPAPPAGAWYWFDLNDNCATSEPTWQIGLCFSDRQALLPSCTGQVLSGSSAKYYRLVSPIIDAGAAGSTTILRHVRFRESYRLRINEDGQRCEWVKVDVFTNRDGRLTPTGYWRERSGEVNEVDASVDPSTVAEWTLPPVPDATRFQLVFEAATRAPLFGDRCLSSAGDEVRWRIDDVDVAWDNVAIEDDAAGACAPTCTAPAAPVAVTATRLDDGRALIGWDPVPTAHHYDVFRVDGGVEVFVARVAAPGSAALLSDIPALSEFEVEAVDASGLCASARSSRALLAGASGCTATPGAVVALQANDGAAPTCSATLTWQAASAGCGTPLLYHVHRSLDPNFTPAPETLIAETSAFSLADGALTAGWDAAGEPRGDAYTYVVRAIELSTGRTGPEARVTLRPGGPRITGTWIDDAGDTGAVKMFSETILDENGVGAGWSRSGAAIRHNGNWSYWSDSNPLGDGRYDSLSCISLVSPEIELASSGVAPVFAMWLNHEIEYTWDGLVVELSSEGGPFAPIAPIGGYTGTFASTEPPPCLGAPGGTGNWINACDYPPTQGCFTGPDLGGLTGWVEHEFDLSAWAGDRVRLRLNLSSDCGTDGGVVIDEMRVEGARIPTLCTAGPCLPAPVFAGIASAEDIDAERADGIALSWGEVADWGGGGSGTFEIWRDGVRIATLPENARSFVDADAIPNTAHEYQIVARSGGGCALPSAGAARIAATDCGPVDAPAIDEARLDVSLSPGRTSIVLRAEPIPGAATYRFRLATSPAAVAGSPTTIDTPAPEARHDAADDGVTYFYRVEDGPAPGCP